MAAPTNAAKREESSCQLGAVHTWQIALKKPFLADERKFLGPPMRFVRGNVREPHRFTQNRPRTCVAALKNVAAVEKSKNQISRDFRCRPIFDFCNSIGAKQPFVGIDKGEGPARVVVRSDQCFVRLENVRSRAS